MQEPRPDFKSKIDRVVSSVPCAKHSSEIGEPCFLIPNDTKYWRQGVCGQRAGKIFVGRVNNRSFGNKRPKP